MRMRSMHVQPVIPAKAATWLSRHQHHLVIPAKAGTHLDPPALV